MKSSAEAYSKDWFSKQQHGAVSSADVVVPIVMELIAPKSVVDVGSGVGAWLVCFQKNGVQDILGIDGEWIDETQLLIPRASFEVKDMNVPFSTGRKADLAISLEVGEHLLDEAAEGLVKSLVDTAPVVMFSAAIPKQGGTNHVNEQWPTYWADLFKKFGYVPVDAIRRKVWLDPNVEYWYAQNTLLYVKESKLATYPKLQQEVDHGFGTALPLVHPRKYFYALLPLPPFWFRVRRKIVFTFKRLCKTLAQK